jgi:hypothetical protein
MGLKMKEQAAASSNSRGMMKPYKMVRWFDMNFTFQK